MLMQHMRSAARVQRGHPIARTMTLPAPVGGWNARDAVSEVSAVKTTGQVAQALRLDNWVPELGGVRIRRGYSSHATSLSGNYVETLMEYSPGSGTNALFAATPTIIYDVTAAAAGTSSLTSLTNGRWSHVNFSTSAGHFMYIANGADTPRYWNGTAWTTSTFSGSGLTTSNLDYVHAHAFRLWFIEKNTLNVWYAPVSAISGTLEKLALGSLCRRGGNLVAITSWTRDGGSGPEDYIVFITSKGEVVMYAGTDPSSITTSALVGVYKIAEPIGRRCVMQVGADVGVLTSQGLVSLSASLPLSEAATGKTALTDNISGAFRDSFRYYGTNFGWQIIEYPRAGLALVNIPLIERTTQYQYVINTTTGAWCRFTGINAGCWGLLGNELYFGGNGGKVYKYDTGSKDDGASITATVQTAFSTFGIPNQKRFSMARPLFLAPRDYVPQIYFKTDYDTTALSLSAALAEDEGVEWDVEDWDDPYWAANAYPPEAAVPVQNVTGYGVAGSVLFSVAAQTEVVFNGVDVVFETGGFL